MPSLTLETNSVATSRLSFPPTLRLYKTEEPPAPAVPITLREVFCNVVLPDLDEPSPKTLADYETVLRHWEKLMHDAPASDLSRELLKTFQKRLLAGKNSPRGTRSAATVNKVFRVLKPIVRCCWPKDSRNPAGVGACDYFKFPKAAKVQKTLPRDLDEQELNRLFQAAGNATCAGRRPPHHPSRLWRAYLILHYNCGPRTFDLTAWRTAKVNWNFNKDGCPASVEFVAKKTNKTQLLPLNATCAAALKAIQHDGEFIWPGWQRQNATHVRKTWRKLCASAGVDCVMEDFRKTCNSRYQSHAPGVGPWILGHSTIGVNATNYWNPTRDILTAMATFPQPACFTDWVASLT